MTTDLTVGHPRKTLWRFLLPMLVSVMFQQFYNIADSMIATGFFVEVPRLNRLSYGILRKK